MEVKKVMETEILETNNQTSKQQQQTPKSEMLKMKVDKSAKRLEASLTEKHKQKTSFEGGKTRSRPQYIQLH